MWRKITPFHFSRTLPLNLFVNQLKIILTCCKNISLKSEINSMKCLGKLS